MMGRFDATRKALVRRVIFHYLDERLIGGLFSPGKLVESHDIPVSYYANSAAGIVDKQLRDRDLAARNKLPVRRKFRIDMRLSGSFGPSSIFEAFSNRLQVGHQLDVFGDVLAHLIYEEVYPELGSRCRLSGF